jgi:hypothetical protein
MAIKGITIRFGADTSQLTASLKRVYTGFKEIDKELRQVQYGLKFNPTSVTLLKQKQELLSKAIDKTSIKLKDYNQQMKDLKSGKIEKSAAETRKLERNIIETSSKLKYLQKQLATVRSPHLAADANKLQQVEKELQQVQEKLNFNPTSTELLTQKQKLLSDAVNLTSEHLDEMQKEMKAIDSGKIKKSEEDTRELQRNIITTNQKLKMFQKQLKTLRSPRLAAMSKQFRQVGQSMRSAGYAATAAGAVLTLAINKAVQAAITDNQQGNKLTEIYRSRMGASKQAAQATMQYASALQKTGIIGDEVTLSGAQQLATFAKYPSTVNKLMPAMDNLLAQQKGYNATTEDAKNIGNLMGKAMMGNTGALRRVGISFSDAQAKVLKYGTEEEKAAMLSQVITENVGDMNKKLAQTPEGQIIQAKNALGDLQEALGKALLPTLGQLAAWISTNIMPTVQKFVEFMQGHPLLNKIVVGITGLLVVGGPLLIFIGALTSAIGVLGESALVASVGFGPLIAIFAGVVVAIILVLKYWDRIKAAAVALKEKLVSEFKEIDANTGGALGEMVTFFKTAFNAIKTGVKTALAFIKKHWSTIQAVLSVPLKIAFGIIKSVIYGIVAVFKVLTVIISVVRTVFNGISKVIGPIIKGIGIVISTAIKGWTKLFTGIGKVVPTIGGIFKKIGKAITNPIQTTKKVLSKLVSGIKRLFSGLHISFPHIKVPHFRIYGGKVPYGIGGKGKKPTIDIDWFKNGGIFNSPSIIGVGEAGREAVLPLDKLDKYIPQASDNGGTTTNNTFNISVTVSGAEDPDEYAERLARSLQRKILMGAGA